MLSVSDVVVVVTSTQVTQVPPNHFGGTLEVFKDPDPGTLEVISFYGIYPDTQGFSDFCLLGSSFLHSSLKTSNLPSYANAYVSYVWYAIVHCSLRIISSDYLFYYYCFTLVWGELSAMSHLGGVGSRHTLPPLCLSCPETVSP